MKRTRSLTLVSFTATVLASCDATPTIESCMAAATRGVPPAACERVLADNEAAFHTGGGLLPDPDQCLAFAQNDSYPQSCERYASRSTGTITGSGGRSHAWIFTGSGPSGRSSWWSGRGGEIPYAAPSTASRLSSSVAIPKVAAPTPAPRTFSIFAPSRGGFGSIGGRGFSIGG